MTPCSLVHSYWPVGRTCSLHVHIRRVLVWSLRRWHSSYSLLWAPQISHSENLLASINFITITKQSCRGEEKCETLCMNCSKCNSSLVFRYHPVRFILMLSSHMCLFLTKKLVYALFMYAMHAMCYTHLIPFRFGLANINWCSCWTDFEWGANRDALTLQFGGQAWDCHLHLIKTHSSGDPDDEETMAQKQAEAPCNNNNNRLSFSLCSFDSLRFITGWETCSSISAVCKSVCNSAWNMCMCLCMHTCICKFICLRMHLYKFWNLWSIDCHMVHWIWKMKG